MIRCAWCRADEQDADFIGRLCDDNPQGDEHEMVEVNPNSPYADFDPRNPDECDSCHRPALWCACP